MKNAFKWILTALLLIGVIAGAAVLYNRFSKEYQNDNLLANRETPVSGEGNEEEKEGQNNDPKENSKEGQENGESNENTENDGSNSNKEGNDNTASHAAPDFTVLDYDGNEVKLSDYIGKPVVLNFWATWCYYCKMEMPDFNEAYGKYPDVQFLMVNATDGVQETVETAKDYVEKEEYEFDVFFDTNREAVINYAVTGFPCTYFIDAEGNLTARAAGMIDMNTLEKGIQMITEE